MEILIGLFIIIPIVFMIFGRDLNIPGDNNKENRELKKHEEHEEYEEFEEYERYERMARKTTELYRLINFIFMSIELLAVLFIGLFFYSRFGTTQILIIMGISILTILFVHGMFTIFLKIYENTLISTFLQDDIRAAVLDSLKNQAATMKKTDLLTKESE